MELSVSILNAQNKRKMVEIINKTDTTYIHLDVMDGNFVPNKSLLPEEIIELSKISNKKLDIHLMVEEPLEYISKLENISNIEYITIHIEINKDIKKILSKIKEIGYKPGLSIKPNTDIEEIEKYLNDVNLILLMTVEPGLGGQKFIDNSIQRLKKLKEITGKKVKIQVDGGINDSTIKQVKEADIAVVGSYITSSINPSDKIKSLTV